MDIPGTPPSGPSVGPSVTPERPISDTSTYYSAFSSPMTSRTVSLIHAPGRTSWQTARQSSTSMLSTISQRDASSSIQLPAIARPASIRSISSVQTVIRSSRYRKNLYSIVRQELDYTTYISDTEDEISNNGQTKIIPYRRSSNIRNSTISADTTWTDATIDSQMTVRPQKANQQRVSWNEEGSGGRASTRFANQQRNSQGVDTYESFDDSDTQSVVTKPQRAHLRPPTPHPQTMLDAILLDAPEQDESISALPTLAEIRHHTSFSDTGAYPAAPEKKCFFRRLATGIMTLLCCSVMDEEDKNLKKIQLKNTPMVLQGMPYGANCLSAPVMANPSMSPPVDHSQEPHVTFTQNNGDNATLTTVTSETTDDSHSTFQPRRRNRQGVVFQTIPPELQQFASVESRHSRSSASQPPSTASEESFQIFSEDDARWSFPPTPRKMNPNKFSRPCAGEGKDDDPFGPFIEEYFAGPKIGVIDIITAGTQPGEPRIPFKATIGPNGGTSFPHPAPQTSAYIRYINTLRVPSNSVHAYSIYEQGLPEGSMMSQTTGYGSLLASTSGGSKACFVTNITNFGACNKASPLIPQKGDPGSKTFNVIKPEVSIRPIALARPPSALRTKGITKSGSDGLSETEAIRDQCRRGRDSIRMLWADFNRGRKQRAVGGFVSDSNDGK